MKAPTNKIRIYAGFVAGFALFCSPSRAATHLVTTGMGPVYDGIGHLLLTPEDLVPVLAFAFALCAGLRGAVTGRQTMFLLPCAWFVGGLAGSGVQNAISFPLPAFSFLILGGLVAADLYLPAAAVAGLAILFGIVHGFMNGVALQEGIGTVGLICRKSIPQSRSTRRMRGAISPPGRSLGIRVCTPHSPWTRAPQARDSRQPMPYVLPAAKS